MYMAYGTEGKGKKSKDPRLESGKSTARSSGST
jgi:hypothetical protein